MLAVAVNLPGNSRLATRNSQLGGAGGIGMLAGTSRVFSFPRYALLIAAARWPL